ncbi:MAG: hypothetical protein ACXWZR_19000 [Mycobacterium sp.]
MAASARRRRPAVGRGSSIPSDTFRYLQLSPDVSVDWHRAADLVEHLLDDGVDAQLVSDLLPLLRAGDLLDRWVERWVTNDRDRYHAMRKTAFETIADGCTAESRTS